ncbi:CDP-glycerol glycerophosphotransferase family protein [Psychrobacter celer]|uniref:CDP-glycerol glycerophosphotransferase family protein n=1 Tax=Psychrobacter celer TaxID=306572 RepID=UPI003FD21DDD
MRDIKSKIVKISKRVLSENISSSIDKVKLNQLQGVNSTSLSFVLRATYFYKKKHYEKASIYYSKAIVLEPDNAYLNFKYGMTFYKLQNWSEAHKYIKKAVDLDSTQKDWKIQFNTTEKYIKNKGGLNEKELVKGLQKDPENQDLIERYALVLRENKKYWLAQFHFRKLLEINPYSEIALFNSGLILEKFSDYEGALEYFNKVASLYTDNIEYKYHIGYCHERLEDYKKAQIYYDIVEKFAHKESEVALFGIGIFHARSNQWDCAVKAYESFLRKNQSPNNGLFYRMGIAYERLYRWEEAADFFEKAIKSSPVINSSWCYKCGQAYEKSKQYRKAVTYYEEAISRSNDYNAYTWFRLGYSLDKLELFQESSKAFKESRRRKYLHAISPKGVIKNKSQEYLSYYAEYYETLKINEKIVLIESFLGATISGNPYAILRYMLKQDYGFKYVVIVNKDTIIPHSLKSVSNIIFINRGSDAYLRYLCTAKYLVNNVSFPYYFIRKEGQVYLNTWHGTPMKALGKDIKNPFQDHANVARNFLQSTHILSQNRYTSEVLLDRYDIKNVYSGKISETGYPRVDFSLNLTQNERKQIAERAGLVLTKPIILYAPTWRGTSDSKSLDKEKLKKDLTYLSDKNYQVVFKGHHLAEELISNLSISNIIIATKEVDTNEFLGITDILITDYSSILFDFLSLKKPIISYIYDFDDYKAERGMYLEKNEMFGDICENIIQVKKSINKLIKEVKPNVSTAMMDKYVPYDDGNASERAVNFMFNLDNSYVWRYEKKKQLLFFSGPFIPNGISRSFLNLMGAIQESEYDVTVLINRADVLKSTQRLEEISKLPNNVRVISRIGQVPMTLEEIWVRDGFETEYKFYSPEYEEKLVGLYRREARRLLGDSSFDTIINFEGYALFWVSLISQIGANRRIIYQHSDKYQEWKTRFPYLEGVFRLYKYYDNIASVSKATMENNKFNLIPEFNLPENKFIYLNNTLNIESILNGSEKQIVLESCFTDFDGTKFITMGRMSHEKDQAKLIDAFAEVKELHPNIRLFLLGDGPLKQDLALKISDLGLEEDVYLLGQKENPFIYLKESDCFVLSSNHEGQPMVLLEALTLGLPVIATDITGNRGVLGSEYGVLVENTRKGLIEGMVAYIENGAPEIKFDAFKYQENALNNFYSIIS